MAKRNKKSTAKKKTVHKSPIKKTKAPEEKVEEKIEEETGNSEDAEDGTSVDALPSPEPPESQAPKEKENPSKKQKFLSLKRKEKAPREKKEKAPPKKESGTSSFFSSLNNIGMGKHANLFIQSVSTMLRAGLPLLDTLRIYQMETKGRAMKKIMARMITDVENGAPFWRAMQSQHLFSPYDIAMVHIGEDAGNLARNMEYLAIQKEKDRSLRQKVKMAMIYPAIVMTMMFVIVMGLGLFVLPNLVQVLFSLNVDLPITTRAVIYVTKIFSEHGKVFVPLIMVGMVLFVLLAKFTRFKAVSQAMIFHVPGVGRLAREATIARFGVILGGLLQAGVPFVQALESLVDVTQVVAYKKFYAKLLEHVRVGDSFGKGFEELKESKKLLPISVQQLVVTGERSGSLSESLLQIANIYDKKASETAQALPVILEPMLLLVIGALVAAIAFAIIVPIYSVVGNVGSG